MRVACENCGYMTSLDKDDCFCPVCNKRLTKLGFMDGHKLINLNGEQRIQWLEKKLGHPLSEEMNALRENHKKMRLKEIQKQKEEERQRSIEKALEHGRKLLEEKNNIPKCPVCGSTSLKKISLTTRAVKTAAFGTIGAIDDAGKTYKCENCGSKF